MAKGLFYRSMVLIVGLLFINACTPAPAPTPTPTQAPTLTAVPPEPTQTVTTLPPTAESQVETVPEERTNNMRINILLEDAVVTATLADNSAARDLMALLPLRLTLGDYGSTEKVSDLPQRLSTADTPAGYDPALGDITYYSAWGNLAIFIKDFGYADGLVYLGTIDSGLDQLSKSGPIEVTIELAE